MEPATFLKKCLQSLSREPSDDQEILDLIDDIQSTLDETDSAAEDTGIEEQDTEEESYWRMKLMKHPLTRPSWWVTATRLMQTK